MKVFLLTISLWGLDFDQLTSYCLHTGGLEHILVGLALFHIRPIGTSKCTEGGCALHLKFSITSQEHHAETKPSSNDPWEALKIKPEPVFPS